MRSRIMAPVFAALAPAAIADPTVQIHDLALGGGRAGYDVEITIDAGDAWSAGGIQAVSQVPGVTFVYFPDPNTGYPAFTAPESRGSPTRFVTFVSLPRGQDANVRFRNGGVPTIVGAFTLPPVPIVTPSEFNVGYAEIPPTHTQPGGFTQRLVVDYSSSIYAGEAVYAATAPASPGDVKLVRIDSGFQTHNFASPLTLKRWGIYATPEPASLALLAVAAAAARRR